jgi:hypothetical protein
MTYDYRDDMSSYFNGYTSPMNGTGEAGATLTVSVTGATTPMVYEITPVIKGFDELELLLEAVKILGVDEVRRRMAVSDDTPETPVPVPTRGYRLRAH